MKLINKLTDNSSMYRNALDSGHRIDKRTSSGKQIIKLAKEMNSLSSDFSVHSATKYLRFKDYQNIKNISLN
jgi:hypothetical protein